MVKVCKSVGGAVQNQPNASQEGGHVAKRRIYGWINSILSGDKFIRFFVFSLILLRFPNLLDNKFRARVFALPSVS